LKAPGSHPDTPQNVSAVNEEVPVRREDFQRDRPVEAAILEGSDRTMHVQIAGAER
jgi:hypothetical protein